uniref:Uncharacterized protein n=1 Tax=Anguilla anguilla TaxID=7936 RepID=A0A0E9U785_ANGAN
MIRRILESWKNGTFQGFDRSVKTCSPRVK